MTLAGAAWIVGPTPSTTIVVGETALAVTLPRDVATVRAGNASVALLPAPSAIEPPPADSEVVAT